MYGNVDSQDNSSYASKKGWDMAKDGSQTDQENFVYNDAVDGNEINDLNEDLLHLYNGLRDNVNNSNNKHNYIKQGGVINEQDEQRNHFGNTNNNPQAQNKHFGGVNELNQNNINNDVKDDDDNNNENQNQARNNNQVEILEDDQSYDDLNIYNDNSEDNQQNNHDSAGDWDHDPYLE